MSGERFQRAKRVFLEASDRSCEERAKFVENACGGDAALQQEVETLLAFHDGGDSVLESVPLGNGELLTPSPPLPERIGAFHVLEVLGEGGMGVVYLAEQESPRRTVALKVVRAGIATQETLRRFQNEADVLARLRHPGIAQIYEAGTAETGFGVQPYFAMELVDGVAITQFVENAKLGTRKRLRLFCEVCEAVQHSHQKGIIHRDLKPSNILVDASGQPKIIDFGVARATDSDIQATTRHTNLGELVGTLSYMSPEQVAGDPHELDTRSDVYALGVIGYELLTGRLPHDVHDHAIPEAIRMIREVDPTPLSSIDKVFRGDIETIVSKALEKDKNRRYQSASDLAADIQHYLRDEPITARPASATYQLRKFARRNKVLVGGVAAVFVVLVFGVVGTSMGMMKARRAEAEARAEVTRTTAANEFVGKMLAPLVCPEAGTKLRVVDIFETASREVGTAFNGQPDVEAVVRNMIGRGFLNLGLYDAAEPHIIRALEITRREFGDEHPNTLASTMNMGLIRLEQGKFAEAERLLRQALDGRRRLLGEEHLDTIRSKYNLGKLLARRGNVLRAEAIFRDALETARRVYGDENQDTIIFMNGLAAALIKQYKPSEAEELARRALRLCERVLSLEHPEALRAKTNLATALALQGRLSEAENQYRQLIDLMPRTMGPDHPDTLRCISNFANVMWNQGKYVDAEPLMRNALESQRRVFGAEHPETLRTMNNLAGLLVDTGKLEEAEHLHRQTWQIRRKVLGERHPVTLGSMGGIAYALHLRGHLSEAEPLYREVLKAQQRMQGDKNPLTLITMNNLALLLIERGDLSEAEPLCRQALETRRSILGEEHPHTLLSMRNFAMLLRKQGKTSDAEALSRNVLEARRRVLGEKHPDTLISMNDLADLLTQDGNLSEAESLFDELMQLAPQTLPPEHWQLAIFHSSYGACLTKLRRYDEAQAHLLEGYQRLRTALGENHPRTREAAGRLVTLYEAWNKPHKAAEYRAMLAKPHDFAAGTPQ